MKTVTTGKVKTEIRSNLNNPEVLEKLYRYDRKAFKTAFEELYPELENFEASKFWKTRLAFSSNPDILKSISMPEIVIVGIICLITTFLIKIPAIFQTGYPGEVFYMKNAAIIVFFGLTLYTILIKKITDVRKIIMTSFAFIVPAVYINFLPSSGYGDAVTLAFIHLPFLMWFVYCIVFSDYDMKDLNKRISFIRYNGDLAIIYALIAIAGGILTAITIGLFSSIGFEIGKFYSEYIIISGAVAAPVVASFIIEKYPMLVSKTAPLIAGIFSPLVLITLIVFLITIFVTGKDPYNDRDFLLIFNLMLLGVMGIIIFSVSETSIIRNQKFNAAVLFVLSAVTIIIDLIALSAIFYRLGEYGITPNRLAVLVSNILVMINLSLIMVKLFRINFKNDDFKVVELVTSKFLPVYLIWIIIVVFGFPVIFGFK